METKCPGKSLELLLFAVRRIDFRNLSKEPDYNLCKETAQIVFNGPTKEQITETFKRMIKIKLGERRYAEKASFYGKNKAEILRKLKEHVPHCSECFKEYISYILEGAIVSYDKYRDLLQTEKDFSPEALEFLQMEINKGLPQLLREEDVLGLLKRKRAQKNG